MQPDTQAFIRHAEKFGASCVIETAVEEGISGAELARLKLRLQEIAPLGDKPSIEDTDLLALLHHGGPNGQALTTAEVAVLAGVPARRVHNALRAESEEGSDSTVTLTTARRNAGTVSAIASGTA
jgi:hypothetical protein